nr:spindle pole body protein ppc89 [Quercus suber]
MAARFRGNVRSRTASPPDMYVTAADDSFNLHNEDILHSTVQMDGDHSQLGRPNYGRYADSEDGSMGSTEMSIEVGRGLKRNGTQGSGNDDQSSNFRFDMGNDSQYEVTQTPPVPNRSAARKSDSGLRREAAIRGANAHITSTRAVSNPVQRVPSDTFRSTEEPTATFQARNTRFNPRPRHVSANDPIAAVRSYEPQSQVATPRRGAVNNPTVQSATYTANSFALPDLPNITELVSGTRKDGTPLFARTTNPKLNRRFASATAKPLHPEHIPIEGVPTPDEEKQIYASLQLLQDRIADLEMDKSEAHQKQQDYENQIIDLQSQLYAERRRPDSALGSDDGLRAQETSRKENHRLQATIKNLQDRLDRTERKVSVAEISVRRVTKERNEVVTQLGVAYFNNEELKSENEDLQKTIQALQVDNERLQSSLKPLRKENDDLRAQSQAPRSRKTKVANGQERQTGDQQQKQSVKAVDDLSGREKEAGMIRSRKEGKPSHPRTLPVDQRSPGNEPQALQDDLAVLIAREVQKHRDRALANATARTNKQTTSSLRASSQKRGQATDTDTQQNFVHRRAASAPIDGEVQPTTRSEMSQQIRNLTNPNTVQSQIAEEDTRDMTLLSLMDPEEVTKLRKKLEQERRDRKGAFAPAPRPDETARSVTEPNLTMARKSSLKDMFAGLDLDTGMVSAPRDFTGGSHRVTKSVRVQSPHTSDPSILQPLEQDAGDMSIASNTSRRRRALSAENLTFAFNIPEVATTQIPPNTSLNGKSCLQHNAASCTACRPNDKDVPIPSPVPVSERVVPEDPDITSATVRPSQPPALALATVIKQLEDEIRHLKIQLLGNQTLYNQHTPALSKRKRILVKSTMDRLTAEIEKRSDQVYDLHDVLEGQKQAASDAAKRGETPRVMAQREVDETLTSLGIDPMELSGHIGRQDQQLDGADERWSDNETEELPWEATAFILVAESRLGTDERIETIAPGTYGLAEVMAFGNPVSLALGSCCGIWVESSPSSREIRLRLPRAWARKISLDIVISVVVVERVIVDSAASSSDCLIGLRSYEFLFRQLQVSTFLVSIGMSMIVLSVAFASCTFHVALPPFLVLYPGDRKKIAASARCLLFRIMMFHPIMHCRNHDKGRAGLSKIPTREC